MKTIALIAQKGGTGKTTIATALAAQAAADGNSVHLLDLDTQGSAAQWGEDRAEGGREQPAVFAVTPRSLTTAIVRAEQQGVDITVIDTPPHTETGIIEAAVLADLILIPTRPAAHDSGAIATTVDVCQADDIKAPVFIVLNQIPHQGTIAQDLAKHLRASDIPVCDHFLGMRIAHAHSAYQGLSAAEYDPKGRAAEEIDRLYRWTRSTLNGSGA